MSHSKSIRLVPVGPRLARPSLAPRLFRRSTRPQRPGFSVLADLDTYRINQRRRLAREMHDDFGQLLSTMKLDLAMLEHETVGRGPARRHVQHLQQLVDAMMASVRRVVSEQPPRLLEEVGLASAIEQLVDGFRSRHALHFSLEFALGKHAGTPMPVQQAVYRIIQESLSNVVRHAAARTVRLSILPHGRWIEVRIDDDGRGMTPEDRDKPGSVGLRWMRDRVAGLGGSMQIDGLPGAGTAIAIRLPADGPGAG